MGNIWYFSLRIIFKKPFSFDSTFWRFNVLLFILFCIWLSFNISVLIAYNITNTLWDLYFFCYGSLDFTTYWRISPMYCYISFFKQQFDYRFILKVFKFIIKKSMNFRASWLFYSSLPSWMCQGLVCSAVARCHQYALIQSLTFLIYLSICARTAICNIQEYCASKLRQDLIWNGCILYSKYLIFLNMIPEK